MGNGDGWFLGVENWVFMGTGEWGMIWLCLRLIKIGSSQEVENRVFRWC